jgi:hypothetical protein
MSASVSTKRKRTRRERIDTLVVRYNWLKKKRREFEAAGRPTSYLREEMDALEWALPILQREIERGQ